MPGFLDGAAHGGPDGPKLLDAGVAAVLTPGATADEVVTTMRRAIEEARHASA